MQVDIPIDISNKEKIFLETYRDGDVKDIVSLPSDLYSFSLKILVLGHRLAVQERDLYKMQFLYAIIVLKTQTSYTFVAF